jgi:hypothetical protein
VAAKYLKIGRNEPCPCGSGKKYKNCCLDSGASVANTLSSALPQVTQQVDLQTLPGEPATVTMIPIFAAGDSRNTDNPKGLPGKYHVSVVLARPGHLEFEERVIHFSDRLSGDSHLAITEPAVTAHRVPKAVAIRVRVQTDAGAFTFDGKPNAKGYLGKLISEPFEAQSFDDALKKAYHAIAPSLSNWSIHLDVPVYVAQIDATELRTGAARVQMSAPPLNVGFAVEGEPKLESEFLYYAGLYREALNSNSPVYRFLCLFKIIEGLRVRRSRLAKVARASGREPERFETEKVPTELAALRTWLTAIYGERNWAKIVLDQVAPAEIRGDRFGQIIDAKLTPLRNEVAHGILDTGELGISTDDMLKIEKVNLWLPLTRTISRRMLRNSFPGQFLHHLPEAAVGN